MAHIKWSIARVTMIPSVPRSGGIRKYSGGNSMSRLDRSVELPVNAFR